MKAILNKTNDSQINSMVQDYLTRQNWELTFIKPTNKKASAVTEASHNINP